MREYLATFAACTVVLTAIVCVVIALAEVFAYSEFVGGAITILVMSAILSAVFVHD